MRAPAVGETMPGRMATRNLSRVVTGISEDAITQASSQERPVGKSAPPYPSSSAARAICAA